MKKQNQNYTPEEQEDVNEWVKEIDTTIDSYVEELSKDGVSILMRDIIQDIATEMDLDCSKLRSFLINNGSKYFGGNPKVCLMNGKVYINSLFQYYKFTALKKLKNNIFLEEMYLTKCDNNII